jgi:hypothetical protein
LLVEVGLIPQAGEFLPLLTVGLIPTRLDFVLIRCNLP